MLNFPAPACAAACRRTAPWFRWSRLHAVLHAPQRFPAQNPNRRAQEHASVAQADIDHRRSRRSNRSIVCSNVAAEPRSCASKFIVPGNTANSTLAVEDFCAQTAAPSPPPMNAVRQDRASLCREVTMSLVPSSSSEDEAVTQPIGHQRFTFSSPRRSTESCWPYL